MGVISIVHNERGLRIVGDKPTLADAATVAGRWEFVAELMQAFVSRAVHLNDCFEHDLAPADLCKVATYYSDLGSCF